MTDDPNILDRIDDTLEQWDEWDGHSPDAARWAGEPDEGEWPDQSDVYWFTPSHSLADAMWEAVETDLQTRKQTPPRASCHRCCHR